MLGIVIANNFLFMYIFWELVGISSYLLIGFWYEKDSASNAGKKAFITNRIGDLGFLIGILILFTNYHTFFFDEIFQQIGLGKLPFDSGTFLTAAGILVFCGAIGKSAQFPLHVWLPDAMEGPTPVSALIHAATMVAAGVYLTARVFPMFTAGALTFIAYIGAITAFISATIAITQTDFKRVLAYSTVSQLGYMIMAIGVGAYTTGFFHLVTHAWFKACLFLASGSVIHAMHHALHHLKDHHTDPQDIRNMGGLRKMMPITYITFLMATIAISGVPFTSGFLSKDGILAATLAFANLSGNWFIPIAGFGAAGMTAFYMFRLTIEAFHGKPKHESAGHTKENNKKITIPLIVLATLSIWIFYSFNPFNASTGWFYEKLKTPATVVPAALQFDFITPYASSHSKIACEQDKPAAVNETGDNTDLASLSHGEEKAEEHHGGHHGLNKFEDEMHAQHLTAMIMSLCIAGLGILLAFVIYQFKIISADSLARQFKFLHKFSLNKWYFDEFYQYTFIGGTVLLGKISALFDNKIIDGMVNLTAAITRVTGYFIGFFDNIVIDGLVNLIANATGFFGAIFRKVQTGSVQTYLIFVVIGIMVLAYYVF
jgi:NADH-quinone oxidoreductase subunit L